MLDELSPRDVDEWIAYRELNPDPALRAIEVLKLGFAAVCHAWGMDVKTEDLDPMRPKRERRDEDQSPEAGAALARGVLPGAQKTAQ